MSEYAREIESRKKLYLGGDDLAKCFGNILEMSRSVIRSYEIAINTSPLKLSTARQLLDTLFYGSENESVRGFNLTAENIVFIKQFVRYIISGRIGWHVDEYIQELSRPDA